MTEEVLGTTKSIVDKLESMGDLLRELSSTAKESAEAQSRREESDGDCDCVSKRLYVLSMLANGLAITVGTYSIGMSNAYQEIVSHDEMARVKDKVESVLSSLLVPSLPPEEIN